MDIRINFTDFYPNFDKEDNFFTNLLRKKYTVLIDDQPDYIIYSDFGDENQKYNCIKIYYTGENKRPQLNECDFAFSFDYNNSKKHYRLPLYALYDEFEYIKKPITNDIEAEMLRKKKFCNFIYSNPNAKLRNDFFHELSKYKKVDAGGKIFNNLGHRVDDKLSFIRNYKFTIAFENSSYPGYTTEKLLQPLVMNSIPIYWGNPLAAKDFNSKSFINYHNFSSTKELIQYIIEVDNNDNLFREYLYASKMKDNRLNEFVREENILNQFEFIFTNSSKPSLIRKLKRFINN